MNNGMTTDDIMQIIDGASERTMNEAPPEIDLTEDAEIANENSIRTKQVTKIIENSTEQLVQKQQKEQSDILSEDIKKRFATLKKVNKDNFNMFEVAITCHKLANDYKKLAKINNWKEIEAMFE